MRKHLFDEVMSAAFAVADSRGAPVVELAVVLRLLSDIAFAASGANASSMRELDPEFAIARPEMIRRAKKLLLDRGVDAHRLEEYLS